MDTGTYSGVLVTGGSSMVGSHLKNILPGAAYISSKHVDLTSQDDVRRLLRYMKPRTVVHLAARVGGILDNIAHPAEYFYENVMMNTMLMEESRENGVERFIGMLSTCIYPDALPLERYPLKEECLFEGPPTPTNFSYGYAKRCLAVQTEAYNKEYGLKYSYLTPCNLYSEHDKFIPGKAHFVADLVRKIVEAKRGDKKITLFGSGKPLRQNMYAGDLAKVIQICIERDITDSFNVAVSENLSIEETASIALRACEAEEVQIYWDSSKPDGQYRKDVSNQKMLSIIPDFKFTSLEEGIRKTYKKIIES
jgi:GDP-L-fucose synthase